MRFGNLVRRRRLLALTCAALLAGCASGPQVESVRSPEADFGRYETFTFHRPLGTDRQEGVSTILSQTLRRAARAALEARGYRYVPADADLAVNFFVETREVIEGWRRPNVGIGYGVFHRHYGVWADYGVEEIRQYTEGTLHVDVVDVETNQLAWEGVVRARRSSDRLTVDPERVEQAIERVFATFPPAGSGIGPRDEGRRPAAPAG
ncbi:MAG TPA: DUF4136 domain-containing protein [Pseudomonadales bacterium]